MWDFDKYQRWKSRNNNMIIIQKMTYLSTRLKLVCTKYEVQQSITAIVWPIQLFPAQKLGFDTLTLVSGTVCRLLWGMGLHGSHQCRSCPMSTIIGTDQLQCVHNNIWYGEKTYLQYFLVIFGITIFTYSICKRNV